MENGGRKRKRKKERERVAHRVEDLNFRIRFYLAASLGRPLGDAWGNAETKCRRDGQRARALAIVGALVYEPGVRFRRGDSILFATIYSDRRTFAHIRPRINSRPPDIPAGGARSPRDWITRSAGRVFSRASRRSRGPR